MNGPIIPKEITPILIPLLTGVITGVVGLFVGYFFNLRRERWNLKRDLYTRLLENLGELGIVLGEILVGAERQDEEDMKKEPALVERAQKLLAEVQRAHHVATLMLRRDATHALEKLSEETAKALGATTYTEFLTKRKGAARTAYELVL